MPRPRPGSRITVASTSHVPAGDPAIAAEAHPSFAKGCDGTIYDWDCWHEFAGKTWPTRNACVKYAVANDWWDGELGAKCNAEPPAGNYTLFVFMPDCTVGVSAETCRKDAG